VARLPSLGRVEVVVKQMGWDELAAARALHLNAVLDHLVDILYRENRMGLLRGLVHRLAAALVWGKVGGDVLV
jgi:hypothetical protein